MEAWSEEEEEEREGGEAPPSEAWSALEGERGGVQGETTDDETAEVWF